MDARQISILLVESNPSDERSIRSLLVSTKDVTVRFQTVGRLDEGLERLSSDGFDVVLLDTELPDSSGVKTVAKAHAHVPSVPIVALTDRDDEAAGASAVWAGAQDYLVKGQVDAALLLRAIRYAISTQGARDTLRQQSLLDGATGLYNREAFLSVAQRDLKLARRREERVVLLLVHAAGLARLAATLGADHEQRAYAELAQVLKGTFRETDLLGRVSPDEFAVLALDVAPGASEVLAARVRKRLLMLPSHPGWLSFTVAAISVEPSSGLSAQELLARAAAECRNPPSRDAQGTP